jgi:hypothetical protein
VEHLPVLGFTENHTLYTTDKDSGIHNLKLCMVGLEEFDAAKDNPKRERQGVKGVDNEAGEHSFVVESAVVLPYY